MIRNALLEQNLKNAYESDKSFRLTVTFNLQKKLLKQQK